VRTRVSGLAQIRAYTRERPSGSWPDDPHAGCRHTQACPRYYPVACHNARHAACCPPGAPLASPCVGCRTARLAARRSRPPRHAAHCGRAGSRARRHCTRGTSTAKPERRAHTRREVCARGGDAGRVDSNRAAHLLLEEQFTTHAQVPPVRRCPHSRAYSPYLMNASLVPVERPPAAEPAAKAAAETVAA